MNTLSTSVAGGDARRRACRGLVVYFAVLVPLSAVFQAITIVTGNASWILALMWSPAAASVVARLVLREGFADVSFRFGGRRTWKYLLLAPIFPIVIGLIAYAIAWTSGLARFAPQPLVLVAPLVGDSASPSRSSWSRLLWRPPSGPSSSFPMPPGKRSAGAGTCSRG